MNKLNQMAMALADRMIFGMRLVLVFGTIVLSLSLPGRANALTLLYTGATFNSYGSDGYPSPPAGWGFQASDRVTGVFTIDEPVVDGTYDYVGPDHGSGLTIFVPEFSFSLYSRYWDVAAQMTASGSEYSFQCTSGSTNCSAKFTFLGGALVNWDLWAHDGDNDQFVRASSGGDSAYWSRDDICDPGPCTYGSSSVAGTWQTAPVPEPETYAMMLAGLGLLGLTARRRRQKLNS